MRETETRRLFVSCREGEVAMKYAHWYKARNAISAAKPTQWGQFVCFKNKKKKNRLRICMSYPHIFFPIYIHGYDK